MEKDIKSITNKLNNYSSEMISLKHNIETSMLKIEYSKEILDIIDTNITNVNAKLEQHEWLS